MNIMKNVVSAILERVVLHSGITVGLDELRGPEMQKLNAAVNEFLQEFQRVMRTKGYTRKARNQSALYNWDFTKDRRTISIDGWHGTGTPGTSRYWGPTKSFFALYDSTGADHRRLAKARSSGPEMEPLVKDQYDAMKKALEYVKAKA